MFVRLKTAGYVRMFDFRKADEVNLAWRIGCQFGNSSIISATRWQSGQIAEKNSLLPQNRLDLILYHSGSAPDAKREMTWRRRSGSRGALSIQWILPNTSAMNHAVDPLGARYLSIKKRISQSRLSPQSARSNKKPDKSYISRVASAEAGQAIA